MDLKPNRPLAPTNQALEATELEASLRNLSGWRATTADTAPAIEKGWRLPGLRQAMALAQAVAALAESLNHHPDLFVGHGRCRVRWTTHDAGGVTALDLDAARQTDALAARLGAAPETTA
nr:4a-hydroxytetrahydrobiopterin dehydratase [Ottowia testudinis]